MVAALVTGLCGLAFQSGRSGLAFADPKPEPNTTTEHHRVGLVSNDQTLARALRSGLRLIPGLTLIDAHSIPIELRTETDVDPSAWREQGADAVLYIGHSEGGIRMTLHDTNTGNVFLGGTYTDHAVPRFLRELSTHYTGHSGSFGSRIAFVRGRRAPVHSNDIYTMDIDGRHVRAETHTIAFDATPSLGPSGRLLFTSYARGNPDLWLKDGQELMQVSAHTGINRDATMSPDGRNIALTLEKDGNYEVYIIDLDGTIKTRVTQSPGLDESPSWSPDGQQLAIVSDRYGGPQVYRVPPQGGSPTRLTTNAAIHPRPDWSPAADPQGRWIAYTSRSRRRHDIYKVDTTTGTQQRVTKRGDARDPSWSPDGWQLVFETVRDGLVVINDNGTDEGISLTRHGSSPDWGPAPSY